MLSIEICTFPKHVGRARIVNLCKGDEINGHFGCFCYKLAKEDAGNALLNA